MTGVGVESGVGESVWMGEGVFSVFDTVMLHIAFLLPLYAVILAFPTFFAVTTPLFTVATFLLLDFHFTVILALTLSVALFPSLKVIDFLLNFIGFVTFALVVTFKARSKDSMATTHIPMFFLFIIQDILCLHSTSFHILQMFSKTV